jgi:hypothetical protein
MGLMSSLAFALIPLVRRSPPPPVPICDGKLEELEQARRERDEALADAVRWRVRYEAAVELYQRASQQQYRQQMLQAAAQQMQVQAQMAQYHQGLPGQWHACTCVPSRTDALLRGD